jgi:hypothetical protein
VADLNNADRSKSRAAKIVREVDEHAVGIVAGPEDDRGQIALGIEHRAAFLVTIAISNDI